MMRTVRDTVWATASTHFRRIVFVPGLRFRTVRDQGPLFAVTELFHPVMVQGTIEV